MKIKSISRTLKLAILGIGLSFLTNVKAQTFRIQEHTVNANCGGSPFFINITGAGTTKTCNCTGALAIHTFSATIQPDPINQCDYLLDIYY